MKPVNNNYGIPLSSVVFRGGSDPFFDDPFDEPLVGENLPDESGFVNHTTTPSCTPPESPSSNSRGSENGSPESARGRASQNTCASPHATRQRPVTSRVLLGFSSPDLAPYPAPLSPVALQMTPPHTPRQKVVPRTLLGGFLTPPRTPSTPSSASQRSESGTPESVRMVGRGMSEMGVSTPDGTFRKRKCETPESVRKFGELLSGINLAYDLTKTDKETIEAGFRDLSEEKSPKKRVLCERLARRIQPKGTPNSHRAAARCIKDGVKWPATLGNRLNRLYGDQLVKFINVDHLTHPDGTGGYHFCPYQKGLLNIRINPATGVFVADFPFEGRMKQSSFFPKKISTEAELIKVIESAQILTRTSNKMLCSAVARKTKIFVIKYMNESFITSCFPLFFVGDLDTAGDNISVAKLTTLRKDKVIATLSSLSPAELKKLVVFSHQGRLLLDLSDLTAIPGIDKNTIYFWVSETTIRNQQPSVSRVINFDAHEDD